MSKKHIFDGGGFATRVGSTLSNFGKVYGVAGLEDDLDLKYKDIIEDSDKAVESIDNIQFGNSFDTLEQQYSTAPYLLKEVTADDFGGYSNIGGTALEGFASGFGATAGAFGGNPLAGAIGGAADSLVNVSAASKRNARLGKKDWTTEYMGGYTPFTVGIGGLFGLPPGVGEFAIAKLGKAFGWNNDDEENIVDKTNAEIAKRNERIKRDYRRNYLAAVTNVDRMQDDFLLSQYAADGGLLETNGATWPTGADFIDNGSTHEMNPFGGVQYGIASDGFPNYVEEGEVVIDLQEDENAGHSYAEGGGTKSKYVLSNRVTAGEEEMPLLKLLGKNPENYIGMTYADIYKDIFKKNGIEELVNRQDIKDYIKSLNTRIAKAQEATKLREEQAQFIADLKEATPEEQEAIMQEFGNTAKQPMEGEYLAAEGGKIYIKPSKRGTFTAAAKSRGMGVQEFASKVLANKEDYSPAMVKKANFARNASRWHEDGGYLFPLGGYIPYDNSNGFEYYDIDQWGGYSPEYVKWLNNRDWTGVDKPVFDRLSAVYKQYTGKTLTPEAATRLGQDKKFGPFHQAYGEEFNKYNTDNSSTQVVTRPLNPVWEYNTTQVPFSSNPVIPFRAEAVPVSSVENDTKSNTDVDVIEDKTIGELEGKTPIKSGFNTDWILPTISGATVLADALGITNRPDYSNANRIGNAILSPRYIGYHPTGRYVKPQLVDTNYIANRLTNQGNAAISAARDLSSGNSATARAQMAANNYLNQLAVGEALAKGQVANNEEIQKAIELNNAVDRANAEGAFNADRANQATWENYVNRYATQKTREAELREAIDNQVSANKSANWNNFLENLEGYFENQRNRNMANSAYSAYGYSIDRNGNVHYTSDYDKASKKEKERIKKEAEEKAKKYRK